MPRTGRPPSNTLLQGKARGINSLMRDYVNLHYGYIQADIPDWRDRSRRRLERVARLVAELRVLDSRTGQLDAGLAGTAYERAGCLEMPGESGAESRRRGSAAEVAADLAEALRTGDLEAARQLHRELAGSMDRLALHQVAASIKQARHDH